MKIIPKIFYSAILIKALILSCNASALTLNFDENVLRQRKQSTFASGMEKNTYVKLEETSFE